MKELVKQAKTQLERCHGALEKVGKGGYSLFRAASGVFVYFRYSTIKRDKGAPNAFFGLLKQDVDKARGGGEGVLCLLRHRRIRLAVFGPVC